MEEKFLHSLIRSESLYQDLSQSELARKSKLSLPMIQLIEAGRTNPSITTVNQICKVLKIELKANACESKIERLLKKFGMITSVRKRREKPPSLKLFKSWIIEANQEINHVMDERLKDGFQGLLLAVYEYYPSLRNEQR
jgi:transcriptional regulator with XRE-family HTH domain